MRQHKTSTLKGTLDEWENEVPIRTVKNHSFAGISKGCEKYEAEIRGDLYDGKVVPGQLFLRPFMAARTKDGKWINTEEQVRQVSDAITLADLKGPPTLESFLSADGFKKRQMAIVMFEETRKEAVKAGYKVPDKKDKRTTDAATFLKEQAAKSSVVKDRKTA